MEKTTNLAGNVVSNVYFFIVKKHTVHSLDRSFCSLGSLVVDKSVTLGAALLIAGHLARKHITKGRECVMKSLSKMISKISPFE